MTNILKYRNSLALILILLPFSVNSQTSTASTCSKYASVISSAVVNYYPDPLVPFDSARVYAYPWDSVIIKGETFQCITNDIILEKVGVGMIDTLPSPAYFHIYTDGVYAVYGDGFITTNIKITFLTPTSLQETDQSQFTIFPNPANDFLQLTTELFNYDIFILDISGRLVKSERNNSSNKTLSISELDPGSYTVIIRSDLAILSRKFIKI